MEKKKKDESQEPDKALKKIEEQNKTRKSALLKILKNAENLNKNK